MITHFCVLCGTKDNLHNHHIIPVSRGGTDDKINIITLCTIHHATIHSLRPSTWNNHSQLVREGLIRARKKGVRGGRKPPSKDVERRIIVLRQSGVSYRKIRAKLNVGNNTIQRVIRENMG